MRERSEVRSEPSVCFDKTGWEAAWCGHVEVDMWAILCRGMNQETGHWTVAALWVVPSQERV